MRTYLPLIYMEQWQTEDGHCPCNDCRDNDTNNNRHVIVCNCRKELASDNRVCPMSDKGHNRPVGIFKGSCVPIIPYPSIMTIFKSTQILLGHHPIE